MDPDAKKALAMAMLVKEMQGDPEFMQLFEGASLEEAAEIYLKLKTNQRAQQRPETPAPPKPMAAPKPLAPKRAAAQPAWAEGADESVVEKMTRPDAILRVVEEAGRPITRMEAYNEAVRRGYIEEIADPNKHIGIAAYRLIGAGKLKQFGTTKPTRIGLPTMKETAKAEEFF